MKSPLTAALLASTLLSSPAFAVNGISLDGASLITSYTGPNNIPAAVPNGMRYGLINFRFSSIGQVNDGWVQYFTTMYPSNQYDGPFKIRFLTSPYRENYLPPGGECPYLSWALDNRMGDNSDNSLSSLQLQAWMDSNCSDRPDPHLYNSGSVMSIQLLLSSIDGGWFNAIWYWSAPMDGGQYNATIAFGLGEAGINPPYAKLVVSKRNGDKGVLADPDYIDSSYNYTDPQDGFDLNLANIYWQFGCDTTDTSYVDTCITTLTAEYFLEIADYAHLPEIAPTNSVTGFFLAAEDNSAAFLGSFGQFLTAMPPVAYHTGDDTTFLVNSADVGMGLALPQTYLSQAWSQDGTSNPNFNGLGAGIQAAGQDF